MPYPNRRSIRLKDYDYASEGAYFITICTFMKEKQFGKVDDGRMILDECGEIVREEWLITKDIRPNIELGQYVIMPNHFHGILFIVENMGRKSRGGMVGAGGVRGVSQYSPTGVPSLRSTSQTIGAIIRGFKGAATKRINIIRKLPNIPVWQRNYYEHVIRNREDLGRIRKYIVENPINWKTDENNPSKGVLNMPKI
jgi:REP element-mobilizing transposase RayT